MIAVVNYMLKIGVVILCLGGIVSSANAQVWTFVQNLIIEPAVTSDQIQILPVFDGKDWAFTTRWDDNNPNALNMHKIMVETGIKGSFYLNATGRLMTADNARELSTGGCSIGGHSLHHYWMTTLNPNAIFTEVLLNRIQREAETNKPINSFAFPFGTYWDRNVPMAQPDISDALVHSGYHHSVYSQFVKGSHYLPENLFSTMNQIVPGDRKIKADKFRESIKTILDNPEKYKEIDYSISLGVHPWQSPEELQKLKNLIKEYAGRDDFWYCTQTEFAAYRLSAKNTQIMTNNSKVGTFSITRPVIDCTGDDVSLSLAIAGKKPNKITLDGQNLDVSELSNELWLVNLPYTQNQVMPKHIEWLDFNEQQSDQLLESVENPGLSYGLKQTSSGDYEVTVSNKTKFTIPTVNLILRKPLFYTEGLDQGQITQLRPGEVKTLTFNPGGIRDGIRYRQGKSIVAAELSITVEYVPSRVYLTLEINDPKAHDIQKEKMIRDYIAVAGPVDPKMFDFNTFIPLSNVEADLKTGSDDVLLQWSRADEFVANTFAHDFVYPFSLRAGWFKAASSFANKPAWFVVAVDFQMPHAGKLIIRCQLPVKNLAIDGKKKPVNAANSGVQLAKGHHRLIATVDTQGGLVFYKVKPFFMALTVDGESVSYR